MSPLLLKAAELLLRVASAGLDAAQRAAARRAAARAWAETPAPPGLRGCGVCHEVAYVPGQVRCYRCGSRLPQ